MDLIDEKDIVGFKRSEQSCQVSGLVQYRTGSHFETYAQLIGNDVTEGRFTESRRAKEQDMIQALEVGKENIPDFDYLPEQALQLYEYVRQKTGEIYEAHGFAKFFDIPRFIKMYFDCTAEQMNHIRCAFISLYKSDNVKEHLSSDLPAIVDILTALETGQENARIDKVQQLQCRWLISKLSEIKSKLA